LDFSFSVPHPGAAKKQLRPARSIQKYEPDSCICRRIITHCANCEAHASDAGKSSTGARDEKKSRNRKCVCAIKEQTPAGAAGYAYREPGYPPPSISTF
jgi:hypothetical protein